PFFSDDLVARRVERFLEQTDILLGVVHQHDSQHSEPFVECRGLLQCKNRAKVASGSGRANSMACTFNGKRRRAETVHAGLSEVGSAPAVRLLGDRHVYAALSRFIPERLFQHFEPCAWPVVKEPTDTPAKAPHALAAKVDISARARA